MKYFIAEIPLEVVKEIIEKHTERLNEDVCIVVKPQSLLIASVCSYLNDTLAVSNFFTEINLHAALLFCIDLRGKRIIGNEHLISKFVPTHMDISL